jgi:hypothetical protein
MTATPAVLQQPGVFLPRKQRGANNTGGLPSYVNADASRQTQHHHKLKGINLREVQAFESDREVKFKSASLMNRTTPGGPPGPAPKANICESGGCGE